MTLTQRPDAARYTRSALCTIGLASCLATGSLTGCHQEETTLPPPVPTAAESRDEARRPPGVTEPGAAAPVAQEPLPRNVAGVALGMSVEQARSIVGELTCRETKAGFQACIPTEDPPGNARNIELYLNQGRVISVSYERGEGGNAWDLLDDLVKRYGRPTLNGTRERDKMGRMHEIYGWKDDTTLYSVRFVWDETPAGGRALTKTVVALWERKGYQEWEQQHPPPSPAPAPTDATGDPPPAAPV
jgi:hypothetical protein